AGDRSAWDEVARHLGERLRWLAHNMLKTFPGVKRWEETGDVLQKASLRLLQALQEVRPSSTREFLGLASLQIRRELLDLKRHYYGPQGMGRHQPPSDNQTGAAGSPPDQADTAPGASELEEWCEVHWQIEGLPPELREVVDLHYYQGLPKAEVAQLLGVDVRAVQRRWNAALDHLHSLRQRD